MHQHKVGPTILSKFKHCHCYPVQFQTCNSPRMNQDKTTNKMFSTKATKDAIQAFYHYTVHPAPIKTPPKTTPGIPFVTIFFLIFSRLLLTLWNSYNDWQALKKENKELKEKLKALLEASLSALKKKEQAEANVAEEVQKEFDGEYEFLADEYGA